VLRTKWCKEWAAVTALFSDWAAVWQGFFMVFILFLCCAAAYDQLVKNAIQAFQLLYFLSSFFGKFHFSMDDIFLYVG
jgi:hypothetical protein